MWKNRGGAVGMVRCLILSTVTVMWAPAVLADNTCVLNSPGTSDCTGLYASWGNAENADVTIDSDVGGQVFGGSSSSGNAVNNRITLNGGGVGNGVYGGNGINASNNLVLVHSVVVNQDIVGGVGLNRSAGNSILFGGGIVNRDLIGGYGRLVRGNRVVLSGGIVNRDVVGGENFSGMATCNTVSIGGTVTFGSGTVFYGGRCASGGCGDIRTGNMLEISGPVAIRAVRNFQHFNFIPAQGVAEMPMLVPAEAMVLTPAGSPLATVSLSEVTGEEPLSEDRTIILIGRVSNKAGDADFAINGRKFEAGTNDTLRHVPQYVGGRMVRSYDFRLDMTGETLNANVVRIVEELAE